MNHVFLPPRLPQSADNENTGELNSALLRLLNDAADRYKPMQANSHSWPAALKMLRNFARFENTKPLATDAFAKAVANMVNGGE